MTELINVEMNQKEILQTICSNFAKLLHRRHLIVNNVLPKEVINTIIADKTNNFQIDNKKISIHIITFELKNISSGSTIDDYLSKNIDYHKFLIVKSFSKKTYTQITTEYNNAEIFTIDELLEDIPSKEIIPEHILLNADMKKELLESFGINELPKIYSTEMMARYYGAKVNDIFRIIRPNLSSGTSIIYRTVIHGTMDIF